jgi:hypothetical protein
MNVSIIGNDGFIRKNTVVVDGSIPRKVIGITDNVNIIRKDVAIVKRNIRLNGGTFGGSIRRNKGIVGKVDIIQKNGDLVRRVDNIRRAVTVVGEKVGIIRWIDCTLTFPRIF